MSGLLAIAVGKRFISQGTFDQVFIVGGDVVSNFILSGFNSFQALSPLPCKPYCKQRSGINIGEAAASVLITKDNNNLPAEAVEILGEAPVTMPIIFPAHQEQGKAFTGVFFRLLKKPRLALAI